MVLPSTQRSNRKNKDKFNHVLNTSRYACTAKAVSHSWDPLVPCKNAKTVNINRSSQTTQSIMQQKNNFMNQPASSSHQDQAWGKGKHRKQCLYIYRQDQTGSIFFNCLVKTNQRQSEILATCSWKSADVGPSTCQRTNIFMVFEI